MVRRLLRFARQATHVVLPLGSAADRQEHAAQGAVCRRPLDRSARHGRVAALHAATGGAAGRGRGAASVPPGGDRRDPEGHRPPGRSARAHREPRSGVCVVWIERPPRPPHPRQSPRRARRALRVVRSGVGRTGYGLRPRAGADARLPAAPLPRSRSGAAHPGVRAGLPQGGSAGRGADAQLAGVLELLVGRRPLRHGWTELRDGGARVWRIGAHCPRVHSGALRHVARTLSAGVREAPEAPRHSGAAARRCSARRSRTGSATS